MLVLLSPSCKTKARVGRLPSAELEPHHLAANIPPRRYNVDGVGHVSTNRNPAMLDRPSRVCLAGTPRKREYPRRFGSHLGESQVSSIRRWRTAWLAGLTKRGRS